MPCNRTSYLLATIAVFLFVHSHHAASRDSQIIRTQVAQPEVCTMIYQPVCGTDRRGKRVTYSNACFARAANARNVAPGECAR
jgi:hypothetical protein